MNKELLENWVRHGYMRIAEDGGRMWSEPAEKAIPASIRSLIGQIIDVPLDEFDRICRDSGYRRASLLEEYGFAPNDYCLVYEGE